MRSLTEYRALLERLRGGTVPVDTALDIIEAAEREIQLAGGEVTLRQAMLRTGRSRSWFEARLPGWQEMGLARKPGRDWLIKEAALPERREAEAGPFDEALSPEELAERVLGNVA